MRRHAYIKKLEPYCIHCGNNRKNIEMWEVECIERDAPKRKKAKAKPEVAASVYTPPPDRFEFERDV
jgi:hypothetical protein